MHLLAFHVGKDLFDWFELLHDSCRHEDAGGNTGIYSHAFEQAAVADLLVELKGFIDDCILDVDALCDLLDAFLPRHDRLILSIHHRPLAS